MIWIPYEGGPIKTTINQIFQVALLYDEDWNSLTNQAKCDCLYELMENYRQLDTTCHEWRFRTTALRSWELCVKHFTKHI